MVPITLELKNPPAVIFNLTVLITHRKRKVAVLAEGSVSGRMRWRGKAGGKAREEWKIRKGREPQRNSRIDLQNRSREGLCSIAQSHHHASHGLAGSQPHFCCPSRHKDTFLPDQYKLLFIAERKSCGFCS